MRCGSSSETAPEGPSREIAPNVRSSKCCILVREDAAIVARPRLLRKARSERRQLRRTTVCWRFTVRTLPQSDELGSRSLLVVVMRQVALMGAVALAIAGAAAVGLRDLARSRTVQLFGRIVSHVPTQDSIVALTFDDSLRHSRAHSGACAPGIHNSPAPVVCEPCHIAGRNPHDHRQSSGARIPRHHRTRAHPCETVLYQVASPMQISRPTDRPEP